MRFKSRRIRYRGIALQGLFPPFALLIDYAQARSVLPLPSVFLNASFSFVSCLLSPQSCFFCVTFGAYPLLFGIDGLTNNSFGTPGLALLCLVHFFFLTR